MIGRRIATVIGSGVLLTVGRGLGTSLGVGRRITSGAGFITTTHGRGCRAVSLIYDAVGGGLRSSRLCRWTSRLVMTFVGIRCRTTSAIRIRIITDIMIGVRLQTVAVTLVVLAGRVMGATVILPAAALVSTRVLALVSRVMGLVSRRRAPRITRRGVV